MEARRPSLCPQKTGIDLSVWRRSRGSGGHWLSRPAQKVESRFAHLREKNEAREGRYGRVPRKNGKRRAGKIIKHKRRPLANWCSGDVARGHLSGGWLRLPSTSAG